MIPKFKRIDWIGEYQMSDLNGHGRLSYENNPKLINDNPELENEIQNALMEKDIMQLRSKLHEIVKPQSKEKGYFELLEDFTNIDELSLSLPPDELLDFYDSLPKVHLYQHNISEKETIHQFYKQQMHFKADDEFDVDNDDCELGEIEEAILEKDVVDLRNKLSRIAKIVSLPYSSEEIEQYVTGEMDEKRSEQFKKELAVNSALRDETELYGQVNEAIEETDINDLRRKITKLMATETSWNVSEKVIEEFIDNRLEGEQLEKFTAEYKENTDLKVEVKLRREINEAVGEKDIILLKERLLSIHKQAQKKDVKSIIPENKADHFYWWKAGVAVVIVFFLISGLFRFNIYNPDKTYADFYNAPEWSHQRSVSSENSYFTRAGEYFSKGDYIAALQLYNAAIQENNNEPVFHFYKAASLQNLGEYRQAADHYSKVILHGDNIFIEESEWYRSLCYVKMNEAKKAREQLLFIIERRGFYANNAKAVLRKMRYSFN